MIPLFKNTNEALNFGQLNKGKADIIQALKEARQEAQGSFQRLMNEGKHKEALHLASGQGQFIREALEVAEK